MIDVIRKTAKAQPFRPFTIVLVDGRRFTIRHPDWIAIPPVPRPHVFEVFEVPEGNADDFDFHWLNSDLVLEIVPAEQSASSRPESAGA